MRASAAVLIALVPLEAWAQKVPAIVVPLLVSPLAAALIALALGVAARSWVTGLLNFALAAGWVGLFLAGAKVLPITVLLWVTAAAVSLHIALMLWLIFRHIARGRQRD